MLPVWFFIVLICAICYLLYVTRTTEDDIVGLSKTGVKRIQYWVRDNLPEK